MELTLNRINVTQSQETNQPVGDIIDMGEAKNLWLTPFSPINMADPVDWRKYSRSDRILIPMYPYITKAVPAAVFGFGMQLGLRAMEQSGRLGTEIFRMHLALGEPACMFKAEDGTDMCRIWVGVGLAVRR